MTYGSWDTEWDSQNFSSFWAFFAILPTNDPENQNFEKMKNIHGDIIFLHMCTINEDHMIYGSWNIRRERQKCIFSECDKYLQISQSFLQTSNAYFVLFSISLIPMGNIFFL